MKYLLILCVFFFSFTASEPMRVFLIGDSTMADKVSADFPETGWGMPFASFFNEAVEVQNHAYNGRSTKSFRREGRWAKVFNQIKKGDYVLPEDIKEMAPDILNHRIILNYVAEADNITTLQIIQSILSSVAINR